MPSCYTDIVPANLSIVEKGMLQVKGFEVEISGVTVQNSGSSYIGASEIMLIRRNGASYVITGTQTMPPLSPGQEYQVPTFTYNGKNLPDGDYTFGVWIDVWGRLNEGNTIDNILFWDSPNLKKPLPVVGYLK